MPSADAPSFALDLAFTPADASLVTPSVGSAAHQRLCSGDAWDATLQLWLHHLAQTGGDAVPKPLLNCEEVCLGLQFVNDEEIAELWKVHDEQSHMRAPAPNAGVQGFRPVRIPSWEKSRRRQRQKLIALLMPKMA